MFKIKAPTFATGKSEIRAPLASVSTTGATVLGWGLPARAAGLWPCSALLQGQPAPPPCRETPPGPVAVAVPVSGCSQARRHWLPAPGIAREQCWPICLPPTDNSQAMELLLLPWHSSAQWEVAPKEATVGAGRPSGASVVAAV